MTGHSFRPFVQKTTGGNGCGDSDHGGGWRVGAGGRQKPRWSQSGINRKFDSGTAGEDQAGSNPSTNTKAATKLQDQPHQQFAANKKRAYMIAHVRPSMLPGNQVCSDGPARFLRRLLIKSARIA
ncbi:hypothetical protein ACFQAT_02720 [Undibacterium arcticum]|uniref:Uncharacterized protein n=1 Tax=Undibacterium arcticum TaxID=1762892 RepID=A0ABV7EYI8_9BURK